MTTSSTKMFVSGWWITILFIALLNNLNMLKRMMRNSEYDTDADAIDQPSILSSNRSNNYSKDELRAEGSADNHTTLRPLLYCRGEQGRLPLRGDREYNYAISTAVGKIQLQQTTCYSRCRSLRNTRAIFNERKRIMAKLL